MTGTDVAIDWFGLQRTTDGDPDRWTLPVTPSVSTGADFLFGGCALGAVLAALEARTDRSAIWATAQYLSFARPPSLLDITTTVITEGRNITQASAVGRVGDTAIVAVNAALGARPHDLASTWVQRPDVPPPDACAPRESRWHNSTSVMSRLDQRWAAQDPAMGRAAVWARFIGIEVVPRPLLAVLGDFVPVGLAEAIEPDNTSNSLDNTVRLTDVVPTEWVLVDIRVDQISRGIGHGQVYLWAEDGTLMGTGSQSAIIRLL